MKNEISKLIICGTILISLSALELYAHAASVETVGELKTSGGIRFPDESLQTSACSGCAELVPIDRGGTGADTASEARENLGVPGLLTPNTFSADQTFQSDVSIGGNITIPDSTASTGIIMSGTTTLIHTFGDYNFFAGQRAGNLTMSGSYNTGVGRYSLYQNTTGALNSACGYAALYDNTTGNSNTAAGYRALQLNSTASYNTALGSYALYSQSFSNAGTAWDSFNTAVGYFALYANQPTSTSNGKNNTAVGSESLRNNTTGDRNTAVGYRAGYTNTTGNNNTFIGYFADAGSAGLTNATAIGYGAVVDSSNRVQIGNNDVTWIGGHSAWQNTSDIRAKKDVKEIGYGLDLITQLQPVQFRMKTGDERIVFGFIAQDIESLVGTDYSILGIGSDPDRTLSLAYTGFIAPLVKAIQEQQEIIEKQKEEMQSHKEEIDELRERLARLEALLTRQ